MAGDIRIDIGFLDHPKMALLRRRIGPAASEHVLRLWFYAASNKPDGDLAGVSDEMIEIAAGWTGEPGKLIAALLEVRYLEGAEGERQVHDWAMHQPWVMKRDDRIQAAKDAANTRWARRRNDRLVPVASLSDADGINNDAERMRGACGEHAEGNAPNPTQPNPTQPNQKPNTLSATKSASPGVQFEQFWLAYPKKTGKDAALKAWKKIPRPAETLELILAALAWQTKSEQWLKERGQYIPNPATYLNQGRWQDQPVAAGRPPTSNGFEHTDYGQGGLL